MPPASPLSLSLVTQWEIPPEYAQAYGIAETPVQGTTADTQQTSTSESNQDNSSSNSPSEQATTTTKRSIDQTELESRETHQPSKRRAGPYGAWSTVAVIERTEEELQKESKDGGGEEECDSSDGDEEREDKLNFEEKTVSSLGRSEGGPSVMAAGGFKGFGFKKRAGNRPQIRQLKTNDL